MNVFGEQRMERVAADHSIVIFERIFCVCHVENILKFLCFFQLHEQLRAAQGIRRGAATLYSPEQLRQKLGSVVDTVFERVDELSGGSPSRSASQVLDLVQRDGVLVQGVDGNQTKNDSFQKFEPPPWLDTRWVIN